MVLTLGPLVAEAGLLKEAARGAVEERGRNLLALRVLRIALHHATARLRDQIEATTKRHSCDSFPSIVPVDEETRDAIVGRLPHAGRVVFLPVCYPRKLVRRTVLAPSALIAYSLIAPSVHQPCSADERRSLRASCLAWASVPACHQSVGRRLVDQAIGGQARRHARQDVVGRTAKGERWAPPLPRLQRRLLLLAYTGECSRR